VRPIGCWSLSNPPCPETTAAPPLHYFLPPPLSIPETCHDDGGCRPGSDDTMAVDNHHPGFGTPWRRCSDRRHPALWPTGSERTPTGRTALAILCTVADISALSLAFSIGRNTQPTPKMYPFVVTTASRATTSRNWHASDVERDPARPPGSAHPPKLHPRMTHGGAFFASFWLPGFPENGEGRVFSRGGRV
jgi:hypothetical protein